MRRIVLALAAVAAIGFMLPIVGTNPASAETLVVRHDHGWHHHWHHHHYYGRHHW